MNSQQVSALRSLLAPLDPAPADLSERLAIDDREVLLSAILAEDVVRPARREHHRRRAVALGVTAAVAGGTAAAGWALTRPSVRLSTELECEIHGGPGGGSDAIIQPTTGDPVVDCAAEWKRETGQAAPALTAYDGGHGGIVVAPSSEKQPADLVPLKPGVAQDVRATTLQNMLDDWVAGLRSHCYSDTDGKAVVTRDLEMLGLHDWAVTVADPADGRTTCAGATVAFGGKPSVGLYGGPHLTEADAVGRPLAASAARIEGECVDLPAAEAKLRAAASKLGQTEAAGDFTIDQVVDPAASCTTIVMDVGGAFFFHLTGPA